MGRTSDAKERLMDAALDLIWEESYGGVTIDDICKRANVKKGSFYYFFDSKADLAEVAIEEAWQKKRPELDSIFSSTIPPLERLQKVFSHPQALSQCTAFLASLPHVTVESFTDTAMSVERVKQGGDATQACIASAEAAALHGLHILRRDIANHKENYTRFLVIAREPEPWDPRVPCKTSVMFATHHERGALLACLNVLAGHNLNLTKLESRPSPGRPFEYLFYADFEGNVADANVQRALDEIAGLTKSLKVFGSYPPHDTVTSLSLDHPPIMFPPVGSRATKLTAAPL